MPRSVVVVLAISALAACDSAVTLAIGSDRPIPTGLDAICVGLADTSASGGSFGRGYRLEGPLAALPQTLRVEAGEAESAYAWVRGDRGGVPVARAGAVTAFDDDLTLSLDRCERGRSGAPTVRGMDGPASAQLASSQGAGGFVVVAVTADASSVLDAVDGALAEGGAAPSAGAAVVDVIAVDIDRDCDDDLLVLREAMPPLLWRREHTTFVDAGVLGDAAAAAAAAGDVDRDGDLDLVTGRGPTLALWRNDGTGAFAPDPDNLAAAGLVTSVRALALGDLDGDGNPDLVVGQGGDPLVAWLGEPGGTGRFTPSPAAVPAVPLDVRNLALVNADDDLDPDLLVAVADAPARLYVGRDGRLEDQTFVRLPDAPSDTVAIAVGGWDASCEPDAVFATATGTLALRGQSSSVFASDAMAPAATDAVLVDLDDDGTLDLLLATAGGIQWLAR